MQIKTILFDFDGVIADSLDVKSEAFYQMYLPYGEEIARQVRQHHLDNGGMSRFEKFRLYHKQHLDKDITQEEVMSLAARFSELVVQGVIDAPYVNGVIDFISTSHTLMNFFIITGTPTEEMKEIAEARGIRQYFKDIFGSPESKGHWVKHILGKYGYQAGECIFIGDALSDYKAATENNIRFILRQHSDNLELFAGKELIRINDFNNFNSLINT
ncbi:MAG: HAD family hydrolase [Bacteroidales bacterium]|nr:HAD family hydrolase [Bacteroidales bacterium]